MKAINIGTRYEIYDDSLKTFDRLPAKTYSVRFAKMTGFFLEEHSNLGVGEKIYGVHPEKADKVLASFGQFERNLGVILSGNKGIGKSLFARLLSSKAVDAGLPVIIVDQFIPGIAAYIESIDQEAVVLFDEFDKTFGGVKPGENEMDPQSGMLSLFDGISQGKKLFIITCNDLHRLNDYLVNRPGRFHYHFRFDYPTPAEIRSYLQDKLGGQYQGEIEKVVMFSRKVNLNYDCLRAIAFELQCGDPFEQAIQDLNIINTRDELYNITLHFNGGVTMSTKYRMDLFDAEEIETVELRDNAGRGLVTVDFKPAEFAFAPGREDMILPAQSFKLSYNGYYGEEAMEETMKLKPEYLAVTRARSQSIHYAAAG